MRHPRWLLPALFLSLVFLSCASDDHIPKGPLGDTIRLGRSIATHTVLKARAYSGDGLNCTSCHLQAGMKPFASPWIGLSGLYPQYNERDGKVISLKGRINDCFLRSMNGKAMPEDSPEMNALVAYIDWLSKDIPPGTRPPGLGLQAITPPSPPDAERGERLYVARCTSCHGVNGQGVYRYNGEPYYPALWGEHSFNDGAGMNRLEKAAAFIRTNMPQVQGNTLTPQEAYDIAAYVISRPRPHYSSVSSK